MPKRSWKSRLRGWKTAVVLSIVMAILVLLISVFVDSWYSYKLTGYNPLDQERGKHMKQEGSRRER